MGLECADRDEAFVWLSTRIGADEHPVQPTSPYFFAELRPPSTAYLEQEALMYSHGLGYSVQGSQFPNLWWKYMGENMPHHLGSCGPAFSTQSAQIFAGINLSV